MSKFQVRRCRKNGLDETQHLILDELLKRRDTTRSCSSAERVPLELLKAATGITRDGVSFTFSPRHLLTCFYAILWDLGFWLLGSHFRSYVHTSALVRRCLDKQNLHQSYRHDTFWWYSEIYVVHGV